MHTMTKRQGKFGTIDVKAVLAGDEEFLRALVRTALQEVLEVEITEALSAEKGERTAGRLGYRSGYYGRTLITRIGKLKLRVPQDREGRKLTSWVEDNIDETLSFYRLPCQHHKHLKSTNMLERLNEEIKRRTHVVRIFPNGESCLRLVRALAVETHENWLEQHRYLNMDDLREYKKEALRRAA
jgi:transposase-like protein